VLTIKENSLTENQTAPRVFLSHASEDKERFVIDFARLLRQKGLDAWLDAWEILPGDSLVDKIFNEGLKSAAAVVIVLSKHSVEKPWVVEELNASIVSRISKGLKIIPVVIDDCEVPESLKSTVWQKVDDLTNIESSVDKVVAAVFDHRSKPPLGSQPKYVAKNQVQITGLNQIDNLMFKVACEALISDNGFIVETLDLLGPKSDLEIPESELRDGLDVLEHQGLIEVHHTLGPSVDSFHVTDYGWDAYFETYVPEFKSILRDVVLVLLNHDLRDSAAIAEHLERPHLLIDKAIGLLESKGHIIVSKALGSSRYVVHLNGSLKRLVPE